MASLWSPEPDGSYEIHVKRVQFTAVSTIGELWLSDWRECFTLEDCVRREKIPKVTAIPAGRYEMIVNFSTRFQRPLPLLLNVPNYDGVRIHPGNTDKDTEGCILVGVTRGVDFIGESRLAFNSLFDEIQRVIHLGKMFVRITEDRPPLCETC